MNLGISTACFYPTVTEKAFECCIKSGSECCEVFFNAYSELSPLTTFQGPSLKTTAIPPEIIKSDVAGIFKESPVLSPF